MQDKPGNFWIVFKVVLYFIWEKEMDIFPIVLYNVDEEWILFCVVYGVALYPVHLWLRKK